MTTKRCEHDFENAIRTGRGQYECPTCKKDISVQIALIQELDLN